MRLTSAAVAVLLVLGTLSIVLAPAAAHFGSGSDGYVFAVVAPTFLIGAGLLAWRDFHSFALLVALLGGFGVVLAGMALAAAEVTSSLIGFGAVTTAAFVAGAAFVARDQLGAGPVPDVLAERFGRHAVYEIDEVQLCATCPDVTPANVIAPIDVYLQNCLDSPRTVDVGLDVGAVGGSGGDIAWRRPMPVELGPLEVKLMQIPFCCARRELQSLQAYVVVSARGEAGKRLRRRRAAYAMPPLRGWKLVLLAPFLVSSHGLVHGFRHGRGAVRLVLGFSPAWPLRRSEELPEPVVESIWKPSPLGDAASEQRR